VKSFIRLTSGWRRRNGIAVSARYASGHLRRRCGRCGLCRHPAGIAIAWRRRLLVCCL